ncbi:virulence factor SrfC family protein [Achromobacter animicus]|uniref:virulence factor SrfC family protein n=1 Tax=Achromobacter animicus TaxID=1389935 RepID=UPI0028A74974|nr:virulence factor SrfC family protein [Achromobacter animicus]
MSESQEKIANQWRAIHRGAGRAIAWIEAVRGNSKRLDDKADALIHGLRRTSNKARSLERAAGHPMAIGFFGLSQAGKSYLISTLAASEDGRLETEYGGQRVDFLTSVNPSGGGSEATGLVTRFTRTKPAIQDAAYPIEVRLFREIDLAKILANAWFKDFDQGKVEYKINGNGIKSILERFADRVSHEPQPGVSADDVVSLWDYVSDSFGNHVQALEGDLKSGYWPQAVALAPRLSPADRAEFFSLLWGEERELTKVYAQMAESLRAIGNADVAHIPLDAVQDHSDGPPSIMNVTMLDQIGGGDGATIKVRAVKGGALGEPVSIRRSNLAALTTELVFPLVNPPRERSLETVDLLDFPGYRGRYDKARLSEIPNNPVGELLRRGKVAYLFELYTENQEMNGLVLCTPAHKQPETSAVVPVLDRWVRRTQGDSGRDRAEKSGLLWAVTMFNARVTDMLQKEDKWHQEWKGLNDIAFKIYESLDFMRDWKGGKPFSNTFLVRTPSYSDFTTKDGHREVAVSPEKRDALSRMRESFINADVLRSRFPQAGEAWDAMMQLDDGGMGRMAGAIAQISDIGFKLDRLRSQVEDAHHTIADVGVGLFYREGSDVEAARKKKRELADKVAPVLRGIAENPKAYFILSELMHALEIPSEALRNLYLNGADVPQARQVQAEVKAAPASTGDDLFASLLDGGSGGGDDAPASAAADVLVDTYEHWFADSAFKLWLNHLSEIPARTRQHAMLKNIPQDVLEIVVEELRNAAYRDNANGHNLPKQMLLSLLARSDSASKRDQMVMSQVLRVQMVLRDFIAWLGYPGMNDDDKPASASLANGKVFAKTTSLDAATGLPDLPEKNEMGKGREFLKDWVACLTDMIVKNAGYTAGQEISDEQNEALGAIIADIRKG